MGYFKERIKHAVRFRHKRGFGVHSPYMFNLILNVIRDKEKQFTYPLTLDGVDVLNQREKKVYRLLSRLIRFLRVRRVVCMGHGAELLTSYLAMAYPEALVQSNCPKDLKDADFIYIGRYASQMLFKELNVLQKIPQGHHYMIITDIHKEKYNARIWRNGVSQAQVSIDMMWYGLLFFDDKIQPGKYNLII